MRLIDADEMIPNGFKNQIIKIDEMLVPESMEYQYRLIFKDTEDFIDSQPTACDIDKIREEISSQIDNKVYLVTDVAIAQRDALKWCLEVINNYTKGDTNE